MSASLVNVGGVVLCGGRSRRMGRSKAWLNYGGEYLLQRMVRIVAGVVRPVVVAARRDQYLPSLPEGVTVVHDAVENGGPLAGMAAGFAALAGRCDAAFVSSCDHPLLKPAFVERLIALLGEHPGIVPQHEGRMYSLTAVYRLDTRSVLTAQLVEGDMCVRHFVERCGAHVVPDTELRDADPDLASLDNVNDAAAFESLRRKLSDSSNGASFTE